MIIALIALLAAPPAAVEQVDIPAAGGRTIQEALAALDRANPSRKGKEENATPLGNPGEWIADADYPAEPLRENVSGTVTFTLSVTPDGRVKSCDIVQSSGSAILDSTACNLITLRARFSPAKDRKGRPTMGIYKNRVRWILPRDPEPPPQASEFVFSFVVGADGAVSDCRLERALGEAAKLASSKDGLPCARSGTMTPYLDETGHPVARRLRSTFKLEVEPVK